MKRPAIYLLSAALFLITAHPLFAQLEIIKFFMDRAASQQASPSPNKTTRPKSRPAKKSADAENAPKNSAPSNSEFKGIRRFDGTWLATRSKTNAEGERITQIFTMIVKNGKATKTLDTTNTSVAEKPFHESIYELHRKWNYDSSEISAEGSSLTIQWSAGQLADWAPKTIPNHVVENFGVPSAETSVYALKQDELVRVNDPDGITYRRAK